MMTAAKARSGFTLLEVLLASVIALLLLGALYVAFDVTLRSAETGREAVARGDVTRAITNRMMIDLTCCIGPMPPKSGGGLPEEAAAPTTAAPTTASPNAELSSAEVAAGTATGTIDLAESEGVAAADLPFQGGLFGTEKELTMFVSGVPPALANPETADPLTAGMIDMRSDLRRVTYYLGSGGLCRQVKPWVTAEGIRNSAVAVEGEEDADLIAEEVQDITFSYFGPSGWQNSWTGSDPASDGGSVAGPPRAIMVTMVIKLPGEKEPRTISHVIPVRAAIGLASPPVPEEVPAETPTTETP